MKGQTIFIFFLFVSFFLIPQVILADGSATRTLEIVYPQIPGVSTPEYVSTGLPEYVNYLFRFAVIIIGILIFGVLVYSGINYLLSFGNPAKLSDAKQGITAAGFGGLILLGAYLIFNTINPQLLILTPPEIGALKAVITPGVYICNYNLDEKGYDIGNIIINYMQVSDLNLRTEAAEKLKTSMGKAGDDNNCFLASYSGILTNLVIDGDSNQWTIFIIPSEKYNSDEGTYGWTFNHGVVFHENDKFGGKCKVFPSVSGTTLYRQIDASDFHVQLGFDAKSVTVFQKPTFEPDPQYKGVSLYEGPAFNEIGKPKEEKGAPVCGDKKCEGNETYLNCPSDCSAPAGLNLESSLSFLFSPSFALAEIDASLKKWESIKPAAGNDIKEVSGGELDNFGLKQNTRSIKIEPKDGYIAVLFGNGGQKCEVRRTDDANLTDDPIGRCGQCNIWAYINPLNWFGTTECKPCLESLYVIKGQAL